MKIINQFCQIVNAQCQTDRVLDKMDSPYFWEFVHCSKLHCSTNLPTFMFSLIPRSADITSALFLWSEVSSLMTTVKMMATTRMCASLDVETILGCSFEPKQNDKTWKDKRPRLQTSQNCVKTLWRYCHGSFWRSAISECTNIATTKTSFVPSPWNWWLAQKLKLILYVLSSFCNR